MLIIHALFVVTSFISFVSRILLSEFKPDLLSGKLFKIVPHVIDTLLLLSGITLVIQGHWLDGQYSWIVTKFIVLCVYIGLGVLAMRSHGTQRWTAFAGAIACYGYILAVAITKHGFF